MDSNPYRPPQAHVRDMPDAEVDEERMSRLASGQKLAIYAIGLYLGVAFVRGFLVGAGMTTRGPLIIMGALVLIAALTALVMSFIGLWRMGDGLGIGVVLRVLILLLMFVPLINILVLLIINARATRALRAGGYRVGFFGVSGTRA